MRVLITGGYGFIGAWIIRNLLARGDEVWVYDLKEDARRLRLILPESEVEKVAFVPGDVTDLGYSPSRDLDTRDHAHHPPRRAAGADVPGRSDARGEGERARHAGRVRGGEGRRRAGEAARLRQLAPRCSAARTSTRPARSPTTCRSCPARTTASSSAATRATPASTSRTTASPAIGLRPWTVYGVGRDLGMTSEPTKAIKAVLLGRPYHINFGGWSDFQYVDDVAKTFVHCLDRPYTGAKSYNLRGAVVTLADFHAALCAGAAGSGEARHVRHDADRHRLRPVRRRHCERDLGPMPKTPLEDGIRETVAIFRQLQTEGRLDTADLDAPKPAPVMVADEP